MSRFLPTLDLRHFRCAILFVAAAVSGPPSLSAETLQWTGADSTLWSLGSNWSGAAAPTLADEAVFAFAVPGTGSLLSLGSGSLAERLTLRGDYTFSGGDLSLGSGAIHVNLGHVLTLNSRLDGTAGLLLSGGGTLRLTDAANTFTGTTTLANGTLIISQPGQLGLSTSPILITETNPIVGSTSIVGFGGGALVLDGSAAGFTFNRDVHLQGSGPAADRGGALVSMGDNTLSGSLRLADGTSPRSSRILSNQGLLTLAGSVNVAGTAGTHISNLGGVNSAGANADFRLSGELTGTGTLNKQGAGVLILTPSSTSNFNGRLRITGNATGGQSSVRVFAADVFGTANAGNASAPIDMNGGVLEIHSDTSLDIGKNVYHRASSTYYFGPAIGGDGVNGTMAFGSLRAAANTTLTFNSRNGYGASFSTQSMESSNNNSTFTNNMGGLLTFTGNFWNNSDASNRTLTISGSGNTRIDGSINTSGAGVKTLTKTNNGVLTLNGTATTLNGNVNISGGAIAIRDFRSLNNTSNGVINLGSSSTAGALIIGTTEAADPSGLITSRTLNLSGTTGTPSIYANQAGAHPVILAGSLTATGGSASNAKTLTLGGTSTADNLILGGIPNNAAGGSVALLKVGAGTWVLAGENTYTGTTTVTNGTLKLLANGTISTVLGSANNITFSTSNSYAGSTFEFVGRAGEANVQDLNVLAYSAGSNTLRVTPGTGGSASLTFARLNTTGASTLNIVGADFLQNRVTLTTINGSVGSNGIITRSVYWNGADFAYREGGVLRAPLYGTDGGTAIADSALTASQHNQLTASISTGSVSVPTLKIAGSQTLTLNDGASLTLSAGGLLVDGGSATITGGTVALGSNAFVVRVNQPADTLTLASSNTGTGGLTKSGAGTLVLAGPSSRTGTISVDEGTLRLAAGGVLSGANATLNIRQNAVFDLNGVSTDTSIGQFNNNGVVTNSGSVAATLTLGNGNGTGTSFGSIRDGSAVVHVTKVGTGAQSWLGRSTYTGVTTLGGTGLVTVDVLADGGQASGIGAASSDAANLVFDGGGLSYRGNLVEGILNLGSTSASTDRLFTVTGSAVTLGSSPSTNLNNAIVWSNPGAIVHGSNADRTFTFTGTSQGFNTFNPQLTDSVGFATSVLKTGTGIWRLGNAANTYSGSTTITQGILMATDGQGLSPNSNLVFDGGALYSQGSLNRDIGSGAGQMQFAAATASTAQFSGGFMGGDSKLTVDWTGTPAWGSTSGFLDNRNGLILNGSQARAQGTTGSIALSEVDIAGDFSLGTVSGIALGPNHSYTVAQNSATVTVASTTGLRVGQSVTGSKIPSGAYIVSIISATQFQLSANTANVSGTAGSYTDGAVLADNLRAIRVDDNGNTGGDFATISGVISGDAGTGLRKTGAGLLRLTGANTYTGETNVNQGTLAVRSLGHSGDAPGTATSVGLSGLAFDDSNAVTLGNGGTGAGILQYIGPGETSDRKIRINTTTGSTQIHADGSGPLILTNLTNDVITATGNKTLFLRGSHAGPNQITSQLSDNGGTLGVTVDGGAMWILTNPANNYTGLTTVGGGVLGIGADGAIGSGTLRLSNGSVFAYGGDLTLANPVDQANNTTGAFIGDYSLTFTSAYALLSTTSNPSVTTNNLVAGKTLAFGGVTANSITANRTWTIEGNGETIIDGDITTSTAFGLVIAKTGNGVLQLNGTGSNFNQNNANFDIDRGTVRLGNNEVIPHGAGFGSLLISPELANEDVATLDLNGRSETINGLTATTDGTAVIDNTSASDAVLTFGANDATVNFGTGAGTYSITDSGSGKLSLVKTGTGIATLGGGSGTTTLDYQGTTTVEAGALNIASALTGSTGISVAGGATLNLFNGAVDGLAALDLLSLGAGAGTTVLGLELGAGTLTSDRFATAGGATTANTIQLDLVGLTGFGGSASYDLLAAASGLSGATYVLNRAPGGYTYSLNVSDSLVRLDLTAIAAGDLYWHGDLSGSWSQLSGGNSNFATDLAGTLDPGASPGTANTVIFSSSAASGPAIATTLDNPYAVNALKFTAQPAGVTSVSIAPGTSGSHSLTLTPGSSADGIDVADNAGTVTLSAPVVLGADQTWTVAGTGANGSALTVSGALSGAFNLVKAGAGTLTLSGDNSLHLGSTTIDTGTLQIGAAGSTGTLGAGAVVNNGILHFNRTGTFTVANLISGTGSLSKSASGVLLLTNDANSFEGDVTINAGTLGFTTVSDIGGPASSLGRGSAIHMNGGTLRFDGDTVSQSTDRPIFTSTTNAVLSLNGTNGATMTYAGAINIGIDTSGSRLTLTGTAGSAGSITGGFTMTGTAADALVGGGTWTLSGAQNTVADNMTVQGTSTVLNLNGTGILRFLSGAASGDLYINNGSTVNLGADNAIDMTIPYRLFIGQTAGGATGVLNLGSYNLESGRFILGERANDRNGIVNGTGTLTVVGGDIDLYEGEINAGFASTGSTALEKFGPGTVTFRGDNSGLASTGVTVLNEGTLVLDYTLSNTTKLRAASGLEMRGMDLRLIGNDAAATVQTVASFNLDGTASDDNSGANRVVLTAGTGQDLLLNLGAITRTNGNRDGTVRFVLPAGTQTATNGITTTTGLTNGLLGLSGFATVEDDTGTWFATKSGDNIVALVSTANNAPASWVLGDHITDEGSGFLGLLNRASLNSLRFDAAAGSKLTVDSIGALHLNSGGLLVTDNVTGTGAGIRGGSLTSGASELILTHDGPEVFEISSSIRTNHAFTKSGTGTLLLSGNNSFTDEFEIHEGTVILAGGNAIGDTSRVSLAANRNTTLVLTANETIGRLSGGKRATNSEYGTVAIGAHTLTLNHTGGSTTYAGFLTGTGRLVMSDTSNSNLNLNNNSSGFTGTVEVNGGLFQLSNIGRIDASSLTVNGNGMMLIDNNSTTTSTTRLLDTASIILNSAAGGGTNPRGLWVRNTDNNSSRFETVGDLIFNSGASYLTGEANVSSGSGRAGLIAANFVRNANATVAVRGRNLGTTTTHHNQFRIATDGEAAFIAAMTGAAGSGANLSIVPWAIGETHNNTTNTGTNMGNSLVTYVAGAGFRPLDLVTEYAAYATAGDTHNTRESLAASLTGLAGRTLNSLVINNEAVATLDVTGAGAGQLLHNASGAFLFTLTGGTDSTAYGTLLGGFDDGITTGNGEYLFHVVNPSAATTGPVLTATVASPLTSAADLTKSGRGILILTGTNTAGGGTAKTTLNEGILEIAGLANIGGATGELVFAGGTLRLGAGFIDDLSTRALSFLTGGGTLDTNGIDLALAGGLGSGSGGFTKLGAGNLTLNAGASLTGPTTLAAGTVTLGASNALGSGNLNLLGGATLDLGTHDLAIARLTTSGDSPQLLGTGTLTATEGFVFSHTGDITVAAGLAGNVGLFKNQASVLTLTGVSSYTGLTEVQAGTLSFDSIANVGAGSSALGNPLDAQAGILRMGLTTGPTTLSYTGFGHSSDRLVGLQGTTGSVTLAADGTGGLAMGGAVLLRGGNKSFILSGSSDSSITNQIGRIDDGEIGVLTLAKQGTNTWLLTSVNTYSGATQIDNGTLKLGTDNALPATAVRLGNTTTAGILDLNGFDQTVGNFEVRSNSDSLTNQLVIPSGNTFTVTGNVILGANAALSTTLFEATGGGAFVQISDGGSFQVGGATGSSNRNAATAEFSDLASFTVNLGSTGTFRVGDNSSSATTDGSSSTLVLALNNTITANHLFVSANQPNTLQTLSLGPGSNTLHVNTLQVGANTRGVGLLDFIGSTGNLVLRAADGTGPVALSLGASTTGTANTMAGDVHLAGHDADLLLSSLILGDRSAGTGGTNTSLTFDQGTLEAASVVLARRTGSGTGGATATLEIGGGSVAMDLVEMAVNTSGGGAVTANLNVTGGTVTLGTGSGTAVNMANAVSGRTVDSTVHLLGGTVTLAGDVVRQGGAGTENATFILEGASLDMGGFQLGSLAAGITFEARSGSLANLAELSGGTPLEKTTSGILQLLNGNTHSGGTVVTEGTLLAGNTLGSATGSGEVTVALGATLGGNGSIAPAANNSITVNGTLQVGAAGDSSAQKLTLTTTGVGLTTVNGVVAFDLFGGQGSGTLNAQTGNNDQLVVNGTSGFAIGGTSTLQVTTSLPIDGSWVAGTEWKLFDWAGLSGGVTGTFSNLSDPAPFNHVNLPDLSSIGLAWDVSNLYTAGTILVVVPEPGRMLLVFVGLLGLFFRRRR